jgi:hypothetical protein
VVGGAAAARAAAAAAGAVAAGAVAAGAVAAGAVEAGGSGAREVRPAATPRSKAMRARGRRSARMLARNSSRLTSAAPPYLPKGSGDGGLGLKVPR